MTAEGALTQHWTDRRAAHRQAKSAVVDHVRRSALRAAAHKSRAAALALGHPRYQGHRCKRGHSGERYANDGNCIQCVREAAERRRRAKGVPFSGSRPSCRHPLRSAKRAAARAERALAVPRKRGTVK